MAKKQHEKAAACFGQFDGINIFELYRGQRIAKIYKALSAQYMEVVLRGFSSMNDIKTLQFVLKPSTWSDEYPQTFAWRFQLPLPCVSWLQVDVWGRPPAEVTGEPMSQCLNRSDHFMWRSCGQIGWEWRAVAAIHRVLYVIRSSKIQMNLSN